MKRKCIRFKSSGLLVIFLFSTILCVIFLMSFGLNQLNAQTLKVKEADGSETLHSLSNIRKLAFNSGDIRIVKNDASQSAYGIAGLRYLSFTEIKVGISEQSIQFVNTLNVYPNPVKEVLYVAISQEMDKWRTGVVKVVDLEGKIHKTQPVGDNETVGICVGHLTPGIYLCRYEGENETKTVKIIKQ